MSLQSFTNDKNTRDDVFNYLKNYIDKYALEELYAGRDTSGIKNASEIIKQAEKALIAEFTETINKPKKDRAL